MSQFTNSTANRLKINKGWKNAYFPETLPLYSRDNVFLLKLYLFLKAYFTLNRTKLIYCDLRTSENYTKILYLVIDRVKKKAKKNDAFSAWAKRKTTSGLKLSPLRNAHLKDAVNLLYLDLPKLKKQFAAKLLPLSKQKVNRAFYTKTRYKSWINFLAKIKNVRKNTNLYTKRKNLRFAPVVFNSLNFEQSFKFKLKRIKNEVLVLNRFFSSIPANKHNRLFYKIQLNLLKKKLTKLVRAISSQAKRKENINRTNVKSQIFTENNIIINKKSHISTVIRKLNAKTKTKKISKRLLRATLLRNSKILNANTKISITDYKNWLQRNAISRIKFTNFVLQSKQNFNTRFLSETLNSIKLESDVMVNKLKLNTVILNDDLYKQFLYNSLTAYVHYLKENNYLNTQRSFAKFITLLKTQHQILSPSQITNKNRKKKSKLYSNFSYTFNNFQNVLNYPTHLNSVRNIRSERSERGEKSAFDITLLKNLRFKKKLENNTRTFSKRAFKSSVNIKNVSYLVKNFEKNYQRLETPKKTNETKKARKQKKIGVWKLRENFRVTFIRHAKILRKYQYKLALQQVLLKYFKMNFEVKIVRPLIEFKNNKFSNLYERTRNQTPTLRFESLKKTLRKTLSLTSKRKSLNKKNKQYSVTIPLKQRYVVMGNRTKRFAKFSNFNVKYTKKNTYVSKKQADIFQRIRRNELLEFTKERLNSVSRDVTPLTFIPIASLSIKYLNPQILADFIAKELEKTRRHENMLRSITEALSALPFARAKGYHVSVFGRINSTDKTRSYFFKRNVLSRQNFSRKVNYASSQARARIGAFGVKVWIFY